MKIMAITGWLCLAIYATIAASVYISGRNATGDRAVGLIIPVAMAPAVVLFALILAFLQYRGWATGVAITTMLLVLPLLVFGPTIGGNLLSSYMAKRYQERSGVFGDPLYTQIGEAIRQADPATLRNLVTTNTPVDWSKRDRMGNTLLGLAITQAIRSGNPPECLEILVAAGARYHDDDVPSDRRTFSQLISANLVNKDQILELLLRAGANPNEIDAHGRPALIGYFIEAAQATILLRHGAEVASLRSEEEGEWHGWDALMVASGRARWDLAQLYLEHGCDPNFHGPDGQSALDVANKQAPSKERDAFLRKLTTAAATARK